MFILYSSVGLVGIFLARQTTHSFQISNKDGRGWRTTSIDLVAWQMTQLANIVNPYTSKE